jgi:hypothetical protein
VTVTPRSRREPVLRGDQDEREAGGEVGQVQADRAEQAQVVDLGRPRPPQRFGESALVEEFQGAGMDHEGTGQVRDPGVTAIEHAHADPGLGEIPGEQQPRGTLSHHDHLGGARRVLDRLGHGGSSLSTNVGQRLLTE